MRVALAELAPAPRDVARNTTRAATIAGAVDAELVVFPELFLSGYALGDHFHRVALDVATLTGHPLAGVARTRARTIVVGAPIRRPERPGEVENAAIVFDPAGGVAVQGKRYLPTFGPFDEGAAFTPAPSSVPIGPPGAALGVSICYDAFFPEVAGDLAIGGAHLLVVLSAAPVTSRSLFEKVLPARAVENALPVVYVNRVGVEHGLVFGGGSGAWDARGEPLPIARQSLNGLGPDEWVGLVEIDTTEPARWRPFRPTVRDRRAAGRGPSLGDTGDPGDRSSRPSN